jgi:TonB family protein
MRYLCFLAVLFFVGTTVSFAQGGPVFNYVEQQPKPPYNLNQYIRDNIRYPANARKNDIQGRVIVRFIVNEDGSLSDFDVIRGTDPDLDSEAVRVLRKMAPWQPGKQNGAAVRTRFNQPVVFELEDPVKDSMTTVTHRQAFSFVEQMPRPPYDVMQYLASHIIYPDEARKERIEGRVVVRFVVNEDGTVTDCIVVRGLSDACDKEALRVISTMPAWVAGRQNGKPVNVYYTQVVQFKL